jgi:hypothetical protein
MKEAYKTAKELTGNTGSSMSEHARAACINDVSLSGDPSVSCVISACLHLIILLSGDKVQLDLWSWML